MEPAKSAKKREKSTLVEFVLYVQCLGFYLMILKSIWSNKMYLCADCKEKAEDCECSYKKCPGEVNSHIKVKFGFMDRIRILILGEIKIYNHVKTEYEVGRALESSATTTVKKIFGFLSKPKPQGFIQEAYIGENNE